ncbi:membrane protein [Geomonas silvestris]|uniref:Membrane protein n=1 Tax=Geomonas silvestris TaxID=2740184 RepID=A0A6V8MDT8_9BACT|nr:bestrophin family ion channel [Geomonas silvestris]GFO58147.1 membrane protein [Geomonas silvestris]
MIVRERPSGLRLFFVIRGSVLPRIVWPLCITVLLAVIGTVTDGTLFGLKITMTPIPFTLIGLALAIFLGFRNSTSYDRYWEGRKLWGELIVVCRSTTRQILTFISSDRAGSSEWPPYDPEDRRITMVYRLIAFSHALRHHLRGTDPSEEIRQYLPEEEVAQLLASHNRPQYLLQCMAQDLRSCIENKQLYDYFAAGIDQNLTMLATVVAGCERINNTPIPFTYNLLLHRTAYLYCFLLPFGLVDSIGFMTPLVVGIVSFTFFGLDALGDEIEDPFGVRPNNLALASMCRTIERDLRAALGEEQLPEVLQPMGYVLQ